MLTGHVAVAIGIRGIRQTIPLWFLIVCAQLPDWADALACSSGLTHPVPGFYSHSLISVGAMSAMAAIGALALLRDSAGAALSAGAVLSHYAGDYLTGTKPTWPGGPMIGLQIYTQPFLDFLLEGSLIAAAWLLYRRSLPREKRSSRDALLLLALLLAAQATADIVLSLTPELRKC